MDWRSLDNLKLASGAPRRSLQPAGPSGDYDNDGRFDLFLINWFQGNHCRLLHNESAKRNWLQVQVVGKRMNRMGIGCQVNVEVHSS